MFSLKLRIEMGNMSKIQQPNKGPGGVLQLALQKKVYQFISILLFFWGSVKNPIKKSKQHVITFTICMYHNSFPPKTDKKVYLQH